MNELRRKIGLVATGGPHAPISFPIEAFPCTIGRGPRNSICLRSDPHVSGNHCELDCHHNEYWVQDMNSTNGTLVNGVRIRESTQVFPDKTTIHIGNTQLLLTAGEPPEDAESNKMLALSNLVSNGSIMIPSNYLFQKQKKEESLFVADICDSTALAIRYGEDTLLKVLNILAMIITQEAEANEVQFLKCTGDGFFATFKETRQVLRVASELLRKVGYLQCKMPHISPPGLRIAIHRGQVSIDRDGNRLGLACHLVFRLEGTRSEFLVNPPEAPCKLPERDRILLTDEAISSLDEKLRDRFKYAGEFNFKGFPQPVKVNIFTGDTKGF